MKYLCAIVFTVVFSTLLTAQTVNGKLLSKSGNITIIKIWGNHQERGYAQGYFLADEIETLIINYIHGRFPAIYYQAARTMVQDTTYFHFAPQYVDELKSIITGMRAARPASTTDLPDLLIANSFLDILGFLGSGLQANSPYGCSCLMNWGNSTIGTVQAGKLITTRNLDWEPDTSLVAHQVMVIHIPAEPNEQPWLMIGFAGQVGVLSGVNKSGMSAFQHVLHVDASLASAGKKYEPIWLAIRDGLEAKDFNGDGVVNTSDMRAALEINPMGYAASCIVSCSAPAISGNDTLVAMIAELTHSTPLLTFRNNTYTDSIPGQNLYAANSPVARLDARTYEPRYISVINALSSGTSLDSNKSWNIMRDSSRVSGGNIQMIQVIPEQKILRVAVYASGQCAYSRSPLNFNLDTLFAYPNSVVNSGLEKNEMSFSLSQNFPNPFNPVTTIEYTIPHKSYVQLFLFNNLGEQITTLVAGEIAAGKHSYILNMPGKPSGIYYYSLVSGENRITRKFVFLK
ncbi:MAG: T9SS type A sorting domain-containing protein [Ignavibacteria bacterium]|nr:T9SS type A sorting domain-containing protein [Ignavibacteria bacterium]